MPQRKGEARPGPSIPSGARQAIADAAAVLATVPPFSELAPVDRARLAASLDEVAYAAGEVIFEEGAQADALYVLREGLIERQADGVPLDLLRPPAVFGDLALLREEVRSATLVARTPCVVWRLPAERFTRLLRRAPGIGARFAAAVGNRLASSQREVADLTRELEGVAERLYASLAPADQRQLEEAAVLPSLDPGVLAHVAGARPEALPLADVLSRRGEDGRLAHPPAFRRFLLRRLETRLGAAGLADRRRAAAAAARDVGLPHLAVRVLVEGGLVAEGAEVAEREAARLLSAGRAAEAAGLAALLPRHALLERPRLQALLEPTAEADGDWQVAASERWRWRPGRVEAGLVLALLVLLVGWLTPPPPNLTPQGWRALASLLAVVPLLALEALPEGVVALALAALWVVGGIAAPAVALGGFASRGWVLVVSILAVGAAVAASGLLYRLALAAVSRARGGYGQQVLALGIAGFLVSPAVPNATSRVTLVAPAVAEVAEALGYAPRGRAAAGLAMAALVGFGLMAGPFLTSSSTALLVFAVLPEAVRADLTWPTWALRALPTHLLLFGLLLGAIVWLYGRPERGQLGPMARGEAAEPARSLALQRALLGPPSRAEKIALSVALALLAGFMVQPLHGVDPAWLGVLALVVLAATGTLPGEALRSGVNWGFALLVGTLAGMPDVFAGVGLDAWLASLAADLLGGLAATPFAFVLVLAAACFPISLVLRWQAAAPLLTVALAPVAEGAGMSPFVVGLVALIACNGFFLPYQSTIYLALYHGTGGQTFTHRQARPLALAYAAATLVALLASVPLWGSMGLL